MSAPQGDPGEARPSNRNPLTSAVLASVSAARALTATFRPTIAGSDERLGSSAPPELRTAADYYVVAATARFQASQRLRVRDAVRHGMLLVIGVAVLDCLWSVPLHPDSRDAVVAVNVAMALVAMIAYVVAGGRARRHPERLMLTMLIAVDAATIILGVMRPELGILAAGYLVLLPPVVAVVMPWSTPIHVAWLLLHSVAVLAYVALAPPASSQGANRGDVITLMVVALAASQFGHVSALRGRVLNFVQIERIRALNRQARRDESRLDRLNTILALTAWTDELTGLKNRASLKVDLGIIRSRIQRQAERYGMLVLDLDRFKAINDTYGHVAGDGVLRSVAQALMSAVRTGDGVYRYGGEEFVVLMRLTETGEILAAADRFRRTVEDLHLVHPGNPPYPYVTVSVGVAAMGQADLVGDDEWFARADAALYRAKAHGRNTCEAAVSQAATRPRKPPTRQPVFA